MRLTWRERLTREPALREFSEWPAITPSSLPRAHHKPYIRNQQIVAAALAGTPLKEIAAQHALSAGRISQLLDRCLGGEETQPPALTAGLVPQSNVAPRQRTQPLPTLGSPRGAACAFAALLEAAPGLRAGLDAMIEAKLKDAPYAQRLTPQALHGEFKRRLAELSWPRDRYPYTTVSLAYASVRRYLHQCLGDLERVRQQRRQRPRPALGATAQCLRALRAVQIDEHVLDLSNRVHLALDGALIPLRLARANVLVAADVDTTCVLGYHLAPCAQPNQQDLLALIEQCVQPWQPRTLVTPGLRYAPGAAFPSGVAAAFPISFGTIQLDNAFMHRARSVIELLCAEFGATLSLGVPGKPTTRAIVESVFDYIGRAGTHRVASTTGSYPTDPVKESRDNRKRPPAITFQTLDEALSVLLTEYNVTPRAGLGHASPLALFQYQCQAHFVRFVPPWLARQWRPFIGTKVVWLHWYRNEHRLPHINFHYARYQGPELLRVAGKQTHIQVEYDRRDLRVLRAATLSGEPLGKLVVAAPWQRFPHSLATRQWIHKNAARYRLNARDPLAAYFHWLLEHKGEPATALSLLRVYTEFTGDQGEPLVFAPTEAVSSSPLHEYRWCPALANHRV